MYTIFRLFFVSSLISFVLSISSYGASLKLSSLDVINKIKRQTYDPCLQLCTSDMQISFNEYLPEVYQMMNMFSKDPFSVSVLSQTQFETMCKHIYQPFIGCFGKCDESEQKTILELTYEANRFECEENYNDTFYSLPCLSSVRNETHAHCLKGACKAKSFAAKKLMEGAESFKRVQDHRRLKKLMLDNCLLSKCLIECEMPILDSHCGSDVGRLAKGLFEVGMRSTQKIYDRSGMSWIWPDECNFLVEE